MEKTFQSGHKIVRLQVWGSLIDFPLKENRLKLIRSTTTTTGSGTTITADEKQSLVEKINELDNSSKWILSTGKVVEDVFKTVIQGSTFEHPAHSFILDLQDPLWKMHFSSEELTELTTFKAKSLKPLPPTLQDYLNTYENLTSEVEIRKYAFTHYLGNDQFGKKWAQQSIITAVDLFQNGSALNLDGYSEADICFKVWSFVYTLYNDAIISARLGEKSSVAVSIARNANRSLELIERRTRKAAGAKVDILFQYGYDKLGCCEMGKDKVTPVDDKYIDDGYIKLPKTLRDILSSLVSQNPAQKHNMVAVGYLMMGKNISQYVSCTGLL